LYAKWNAAYELGDTGPGGGKIFYRSEEGFTVQMVDPDDNYTAHYFEAAPKIDLPSVNTRLCWASSGSPADSMINDAKGTAIGTGQKNTQAILAVCTDPANDAPAANECNTYSNNGKTDWFLPSRNELLELYRHYDANGKGTYAGLTQLSSPIYWCSSQDNTYSISSQYLWFDTGTWSGATVKTSTAYVRPIRAF